MRGFTQIQSNLIAQIRVYRLISFGLLNPQNVDQFLHRSRTLLQRDSFRQQVNLDDLLESPRAQFAGHTNVEAVDSILTFEICSAR